MNNEYNDLDKIGSTLINPRYLVYIEAEEPVIYGTNNLTSIKEINQTIHYIRMRQTGQSMASVIKDSLTVKPSLVITDTKTLIDRVFEYTVYH